MRPLPPFKVKPLRTITVRRIVSADSIRELAEQEQSIKPARAALCITKPPRKAALKILSRASNDTH
jgi:hypothetical protein